MRWRTDFDALRAYICRRHNERALAAGQWHAARRDTSAGAGSSTRTVASAHAFTVANAGSIADTATVASATAGEEHRKADR